MVFEGEYMSQDKLLSLLDGQGRFALLCVTDNLMTVFELQRFGVRFKDQLVYVYFISLYV